MTPEISSRFRGPIGAFHLDVSFKAPGQGITALFGPSGCGKTTLLRAIAGLHRFEDGYFALGPDVWQDATQFRPTHRRPLGYVFQEPSLFPHLSVRGNLLYGHRRALRAGIPESIRLNETVDLLGLPLLLDRSPANLSGGERQRVALGRALLSQPRLLLMDEPLAALDRFAREEILPYLERLRDRLALPILYVTHDVAEVERLADHILLLRAGRLVASGPLAEIQSDPSLPLSRMRDASVTLAARVTAHDPGYDLTTLSVPGGALLVPGQFGDPGTPRRLSLTASDVSLVRDPPKDSTILNILPARVVALEDHPPAQVTVLLALGADGTGARILSRITRKSRDALALAPGQPVFAQIKGIALMSTSVPPGAL